MPWDRTRYPANWEVLARAVKERAGWRCAHCGAVHGTLVVSAGNRLYRVALAACHVDPEDLANPDAELVVLCQGCHLRLDALHHWRTRRRRERAARIEAGQLEWHTERQSSTITVES